MSLFKCLLFATLVSQVLPAAQGEARCPGNLASLPVHQVLSSAIVIPVEVNHFGPYDFIVDTGAQVSSIDGSLAAVLHLKPQRVVGVAGAATYAPGWISQFGPLAGRNARRRRLPRGNH